MCTHPSTFPDPPLGNWALPHVMRLSWQLSMVCTLLLCCRLEVQHRSVYVDTLSSCFHYKSLYNAPNISIPRSCTMRYKDGTMIPKMCIATWIDNHVSKKINGLLTPPSAKWPGICWSSFYFLNYIMQFLTPLTTSCTNNNYCVPALASCVVTHVQLLCKKT